MVYTLVLLVNKDNLKLWSLQLVCTHFLERLRTLWTLPIKLVISKRQGHHIWCIVVFAGFRLILSVQLSPLPLYYCVDAEMLWCSVGLNGNRELLYMFHRCWDASRNNCHVSYSTSCISARNWQFACPSHWRNPNCHAYCSISHDGNRFSSPSWTGWLFLAWYIFMNCFIGFEVD